MTKIFSPNDMLLDQTMLCEASRLLENCPEGNAYLDYLFKHLDLDNIDPLYRHSYLIHTHNPRNWRCPPSNAERLFNLSMLLDGLALHDHLYVLKAELPPDAPTLRLRRILIEKGIVEEIETISYLPQLGRELESFLHSKSPFREQEKQLVEQIRDTVDDFLGNNTSSEEWAGKAQYAHMLLSCLTQGDEGVPDDYEDLDVKGKYFLSQLFRFPSLLSRFAFQTPSGSGFDGISQLRTFIYWRISEYAAIPLYPSSRRLLELDALATHIQSSTAEKIYSVIAKAFKENIELVYESETQVPLFLPPSLSIFLDLYRSSHDLSKAIDDFRDEFAGVRQDFGAFEEKLMKATTLQERIEVKHRLNETMKSLKTHYQLNDDSVLETVLGFAPEVLNPLSNPADPSKYSSKLLTMPLEWIKDWWKRRSLRHVFRLRKRLYQVAQYERLASEVLGVDFNQLEYNHDRHPTTDYHDFYKYYDKYLTFYNRER